jgi:NAD(P)H-flavin reductase
VPLITVTTFILLVSMGILALEPVRRRAFELFYYAHLFAVYTTVPAVLWHAAAGWEYLLPGLTVWFADRLLRHVRSSRTATVTEQRLCADDVVTLRFHQPGLEVRPGQYVFVHIAELSALEWHPFTVSSVDNERHSFTVHIKAMQPPSAGAPPPAYLRWLPSPASTWTQRLKRAVVNKIPLTLSVDGPCGPLHDFAHFRQILLVAGGIGITPCAALIERLRVNMQLERLQLHWATRDAALAKSFAGQLTPIPGDTRYHGSLYVTRDASDENVSNLPLRLVAGRPDLDRIMDSMYDPKDPDPASTLVFVCGTRGMVESCASLAIAKGFTFHEETFFL